MLDLSHTHAIHLIWSVNLLLPHAVGKTTNVCVFFKCFYVSFFWPLLDTALLCGVYSLKWPYRQISHVCYGSLQHLQCPSVLSLVSLLHLWLMPSLSSLWFCVLRGILHISDIFSQPNPDLYFSPTLFLTCLECSLVFMLLAK